MTYHVTTVLKRFLMFQYVNVFIFYESLLETVLLIILGAEIRASAGC